jgi:hypothetical protein
MTESTDPDRPSADDLTSTPSGAAAQGEGSDVHGVAREVYETNEEGGAEEAAETPGG